MDSKLIFTDDNGEDVTLFILDETRIAGKSYILVTESDPDAEGNAEDDALDVFIMKDMSAEDESEARYVPVEDDEEMEAVFDVFVKMDEEDE